MALLTPCCSARSLLLGRLVVLVVLLAGCGGGAGSLLETAQFEELQQNKTHARQLYEQILREYPSSPEATTARERLAAFDKEAAGSH